MSVKSQEDRTVEVLGVPEGVDDELLSLYFENKRRSGGGSLVSLEKKGSRAFLVFEEAEVAARVLSKGPHVVHNAELTVRKPASKDPRRLLLRGINPNTSKEMVELFVENMMGMDLDHYTLSTSSSRDLVIIHFHQPVSKDFQKLSAKISQKPLEGARIILEQIEQTDSILVENLHPSITEDLLTLYFKNRGWAVKEVSRMAEGIARVSFVDFESVEHVLELSHTLNEAKLTVEPYFAFFQSEESLSSQSSSINGTSNSSTSSIGAQSISVDQVQTSSLTPVSVNYNQSASEPLLVPAAEVEPADVGMEDLTDAVVAISSHIPVLDPVKLALLQISPLAQNIQQAHPNFNIRIEDDGVHMVGPDKLGLEQLKNTILEFLGGITQAHLTFDPEKAQFLVKEEVKERLIQALKDQGLPSMYSVTGCVVVVTSLSQSLLSQACSLLKSLLCDFSIPVDREYECMLYSHEWSGFLQSLGSCSAKVSESGGKIDVLTLKGMEDEKQVKIVEFLSTPIQRETVIYMEPGMLKYIQMHCHQLLAEMDQVSILPLEAEDVCGLKICGNAGACQMADEVLQGVVSSICTKTITVSHPGVARFLIQGEGANLIAEMTAKFQVFINLEKVHWEPLDNQDIFEAAWKIAANQNFQRKNSDGAVQPSTSGLRQTDQKLNTGLIEEAKKLFSAIDEKIDSGLLASVNRAIDMEEEDLYTVREPMALSLSNQPPEYSTDIEVEDIPQPLVEEGDAGGPLDGDGDLATNFSSNLEEEAQLSLAIQYSMETTKRSLADEEEELKKVLELSRKMVRHDSTAAMPANENSQLEKAVQMSLQDAIKAANTGEIFVFAGYTCDCIRVDIALRKKATARQCEEKVEHKNLKSLSKYHKSCVELIKRKHAVEIQIQGTTAIISGFKDYVTEAVPDMKLLLKRISRTTSDSDIVRTVQWVWHDQAASVETPYSEDVTVFIENAWKMKQKKIEILLNNQPYIINIEKMQEYNVASGKSVPISRKILSSGDLYTDLPDEDLSLLSSLPDASRVNEDSDEFQDVVKEFYESIHGYHNKIRIIKVDKLMNRLLYNQYKLKKASMSQSATEVERTLYHGTSETSVKEICVHGFNRSFCGKNATVYGQGVYFAVNSTLSVQDQYSPPNADGYKFIFVTKVLTGDFIKGSYSMKTAPLKESSDIPLRYDSVADNTDDPTLFVIFNDTQAYPEYLITCQKIHR